MIQFAAAASSVASTLTGGLIHGSSTAASNAATDAAYNGAMGGDQKALDSLVAKAGYAGGAGMAVGAGAKEYAQGKLLSLVSSGSVIGPGADVKTNRDMGYPKFPDLPYGTPNLVGKYLIANANKAQSIAQVTGLNLSNQLSATNMPTWMLVVVAGLLGWGLYKIVKKG